MHKLLATAAVLALVSTGVAAQTPPAKDGPQNSAINSPDSTNRQVNAPVKGANSFTEGEAKSRIEKLGFASVSDLKKDDHGVWRGHAMKDGKTVDVSVDYQGNVIHAAQGTTAPSNAAKTGSGR
jgi:hypothetical protein